MFLLARDQVYLGLKCVYCGERLDQPYHGNKNIIVSHNFGHYENLTTNLKEFNNNPNKYTDNSVLNYTNIHEWHFLFNIMHEVCNGHQAQEKEGEKVLDSILAGKDKKGDERRLRLEKLQKEDITEVLHATTDIGDYSIAFEFRPMHKEQKTQFHAVVTRNLKVYTKELMRFNLGL